MLGVVVAAVAAALASSTGEAAMQDEDDGGAAALPTWAEDGHYVHWLVQNAVLLPASHEVMSGAGIEQFFGGLVKNKVTAHTLEPIRIIEAGDTLIVASKWAAKGRDDKGNATALGGIATHVLQKQPDRSLKVKLHTFN